MITKKYKKNIKERNRIKATRKKNMVEKFLNQVDMVVCLIPH